jgi:hypothetical protein
MSSSAFVQGNVPSTSSGGKGDDHKADSDIRSQIALLSSQVAALVAAQLPSPAAITTTASGSTTATQPSLVAGIRSGTTTLPNVAVKRVSNGSTTSTSSFVVAPSTPVMSGPASAAIINLPSVNQLADIGLDGQQDEPTAAARAAALAAPMAVVQCQYVDTEHDGSFTRWFKDNKWKDSYAREAKMLSRFADLCRNEVEDVANSELMEAICCRIAALDTLNRGLGSAAADAIEGKHRSSIVPHHVRISAIKEGSMMQRITATTPKHVNNGDGAGIGGKGSKGKAKKNGGEAAGGAARQVATTGGDA